MSFIFATGGIVLLAIAVMLFLSHRKWRSTAQSCSGTVTKVSLSQSRVEGRASTTYYPTVQFEAEGRVIEYTAKVGGNKPYTVGQSVTVYYQKGAPDKPQLGNLSVRLFFALFIGIVALVVLAYGIIQRQNENSLRSLKEMMPSAPVR